MTGRDRPVPGAGLSIPSRASRVVVAGFSLGLSLGLVNCGGSGAQLEPVQEPTPGLRAFTGARLIVGSGSVVIDDGVLIVRDGRIASVGDRDTVEIPGDAHVEDVSGRTIIPGLINAHGHVNNVRGLQADPAFYTEAHVEDQLGLYARYGVTTVFSLGGGGPAGVAVRDRQGTDLEHARLSLSGPVITASTPEDAADRVNAVADMGVTQNPRTAPHAT